MGAVTSERAEHRWKSMVTIDEQRCPGPNNPERREVHRFPTVLWIVEHRMWPRIPFVPSASLHLFDYLEEFPMFMRCLHCVVSR